MKTIQEYFAELSAAGLAPNWKNVTATTIDSPSGETWTLYSNCYADNDGMEFLGKKIMLLSPYIWPEPNAIIQLRSNGIDLVKLEWQKPTDADAGKMCWFLNGAELILSKLYKVQNKSNYKYKTNYDGFVRCLLATHGRLCPTVDDFEEVYKRSTQ